MTNKIGRPSRLTKELLEKIILQVVEGKSLKNICEKENMPNIATVFRWLSEGRKSNSDEILKNFCDKYAHAREIQQDVLVEEMLDIARKANSKNFQASRLLIDTLKWRAGKLAPKVYGEKEMLEVAGVADRPLIINFARANGEKENNE